MIGYIKDKDVYALFDERGTARLHVGDIDSLERIYFPAELHVGDRAWKKAMSILDKKYAEAKKMPFVRDPLAWALYHTWREFDDGKRCDCSQGRLARKCAASDKRARRAGAQTVKARPAYGGRNTGPQTKG